jgi:hypothetical protein
MSLYMPFMERLFEEVSGARQMIRLPGKARPQVRAYCRSGVRPGRTRSASLPCWL